MKLALGRVYPDRPGTRANGLHAKRVQQRNTAATPETAFDGQLVHYPIDPTEAPPIGGAIKLGFDVTGAVIALMMLFPLLCLIALIIKLSGAGPALYRHSRIGQNGRMFSCWKFRTMVVNSDDVLRRHIVANPDAAAEWEQTRKLKQDPRITPIGLVLRKSSADELPQLFNIIRGEMSFVGPRPIVSAEVRKYGPYINDYLRARPGLTGAWQVSGRNDTDYETRVQLDRAYVQNWSLWRDVIIIAKTVRVVLATRGSY
jgi:exopolysaccharide production protein ExoY